MHPCWAPAAEPPRSARADGITFVWFHRNGRLYGRVAKGRAHAEVHIARVPDHVEVETLGGIADLGDVDGGRAEGRTWLAFSLPHRSGGPFDVDLSPGRTVHLMLAWSLSADFDHHSRLRVHRDVVL